MTRTASQLHHDIRNTLLSALAGTGFTLPYFPLLCLALVAADADVRGKATLRQAIDLSADGTVRGKLQVAPAWGLRV